jgi:hypothetical protein
LEFLSAAVDLNSKAREPFGGGGGEHNLTLATLTQSQKLNVKWDSTMHTPKEVGAQP